MVRTTPDCCIGSSFVTRGADSRIAVSAINRSAGSPGKSAGNSAAMTATAGVMVNNSTRGSVNASCNQWSGDRSRPIGLSHQCTHFKTANRWNTDSVGFIDRALRYASQSGRRAYSPYPGVRVEDNHRSTSHESRMGPTISP